MIGGMTGTTGTVWAVSKQVICSTAAKQESDACDGSSILPIDRLMAAVNSTAGNAEPRQVR
jgi:hypothetical protein